MFFPSKRFVTISLLKRGMNPRYAHAAVIIDTENLNFVGKIWPSKDLFVA